MGNFIINNMLSKLRLINKACMRNVMPQASQRFYRTQLGLDADQLMNVAESEANSSVELWKATVDANANALVLKTKDEDELGYVIDAENLEKFKKPVHFVNFIKQMEAYKEEHNRLPHEDTKATKYTMAEAFPGLPVPSM